nr:histidine ammonia-lyase [Geminicoccus roseus]
MPVLIPGRLVLDELARWVAAPGLDLVLDESFRPKIEAAARLVADAAAADAATYGVNTGFGKLAQTRISPAQVEELQKRLVLSHMCGVGRPLDDLVVRLVLVLKAASLAHGHSGVKVETIEALLTMLRHDALPVIPAKGSVGASGDLAPLAHMSGALIGVGQIRLKGETLPADEALARIGLQPLTLGAKEGLALLNGTQVSTALAITGWWQAQALLKSGLLAGAMTVDAAKGSDTPFDPRIQKLRNQIGQGIVAAELALLLEGSEIRESHRFGDDRVQDPYCLRCQPQVMGACWDLLSDAAGILEREANGVSDNPLVFPEDGLILSGGNFHAEPVAMAADRIALAMAEIGSISERRIALLIDPSFSLLPAFLTPSPGLNSGFMIAQVTAAALQMENKHLANPVAVESLPTSANQEDHVSMATYAARRLSDMAENLAHVLAVELMAAAQGIEFRRPLRSSPRLEKAFARIRAISPKLEDDRELGREISGVAEAVRVGHLAAI